MTERQTMRKNIISFFTPIVFLLLMLFSQNAAAEKKIGIFLFSDDERYIVAAKGIRDTLRENGFEEPKIKFIQENAGANKAQAAELVKKYSLEKLDLIFSIGTPFTIALARDIKDIPIVFSTVYDPVESGIAKGWKSSGNNTTGTSSKVPMSKLLDVLVKFKSIKRLAVLYAPGEVQSELQVKDLQKARSDYAITILPVPLTRKEDFSIILSQVLLTADALYITGSNLVNSQIPMIVESANQAKVITITHLEDLVAKGILLGVCSNSYKMGQLAGEKGVKILKGAKPSAISIDMLKEHDVLINMKTLAAGQFQAPMEFMKSVVTRKIQ
jgi:putative ABC transport system substrate-binding protein